MYEQALLVYDCHAHVKFFLKIIVTIAAKWIKCLIIRLISSDNKHVFIAAKLPLLPLNKGKMGRKGAIF